MKDRLIGALTINARIYDEIKQDEKATSQAAIVFIIAAILSAIGGGFLSSSIPTGIVSLLLWAVISWALWAAICYIVGTKVFKGEATMSQLLRTMGFAYAPSAFHVFSLLPFIGIFIPLLVAAWLLASIYVAVRETLDIEGGQAFATVIIGWFVYLIGLGVVLSFVGALEGIVG